MLQSQDLHTQISTQILPVVFPRVLRTDGPRGCRWTGQLWHAQLPLQPPHPPPLTLMLPLTFTFTLTLTLTIPISNPIETASPTKAAVWPGVAGGYGDPPKRC